MSENVKVYKMNDYEWVASKWDIEKTNEWYKKEYGLDEDENPLEDIEECDIEGRGMWGETTEPKYEELLGNNDSIISVDGPKPGDIERYGSSIFVYMTFKQAIEENGDFEEPFIIASKEY